MSSRLLLHLLLLLTVAPLLPGIINRSKAAIAGRRGPPLLQLYWDLAKLLRKGQVIGRATTWLFRAGPIAALAIPLLAALLLPFGHLRAPLSFAGDPILLVYLFALARFFLISAALDTGSAFEGMGAAREATYACLAEPTLLLAFMVLARLGGSLSLDGMYGALLAGGQAVHAAAGITLPLTAVCLFMVMLVENCRIPFDDPNTHLELTMIHEVMVLDHSGPDLALILYGSALKLMTMGTLIVNLVLPAASPYPLLDTFYYLAALAVLAAGIGVVESSMARLRLLRVPQLLVGTSLLSLLALILLLR